MRHFNRGSALVFIFIIVVAALSIRWTYQRVEGRYQPQFNELAEYTVDDWLEVLRLEEILGDPPVTPLSADQLPLLSTPSSESDSNP